VIEEVRDVTTGLCFAKKTFRLDAGRLDEAKQILRHEAQTIRGLAPHPHVIRIHTTYIVEKKLAVILQPAVSQGALATFLSIFRNVGEHENAFIIRRAFGCLPRCMDYMHSDALSHMLFIRNKDAKPRNILFHQDFTDFGLSNHCTHRHTTTSVRPAQFTAKYCAPEAADLNNRNRKSDIFSLGCEFLDMFASL
ncbi:kinase-like protein, partial [Lindgomyces ingoldianus]